MNTVPIPLTAISVSQLNIRKDLESGQEDATLDGLAQSIREHGLLSPVTVRDGGDGQYELIAGQRRYLACCQLGWDTIPANVRNDLDDHSATAVSLIENVQRAETLPLDKAKAYRLLLDQYRGNEGRVAQETGVTIPTIRRYVSLLDLAPEVQDELSTGSGPAGVGTMSALSRHVPQEDQATVLNQIDGFNQKTQLRILRESEGRLDRVEELREQALKGEFEVVTCNEALCPVLPEDAKRQIKERIDQGATVSLIVV